MFSRQAPDRGRRRGLVGTVAIALLSALTLVAPAATAHADQPTAMQKCQAGAAPDAVQTVVHSGSQTGVSYPSGSNPDNAIFPGDVVLVKISGTVNSKDPWTGTTTFGPNGTGVAADSSWPFPGMKQMSSIARWNNNPGGWVGSPMQTTSLAACTAAPSAYPVRLLYYINDPVLTNDNSGQWTITTQVWRAPGRVSIDSAEATQGIQTPDNKVPLIAGKQTFVRIYVRGVDDGNGPMSGVTGTLTTGGTVHYPLGTGSTTAQPSGGDHANLADSLQFQLDASDIAAGGRTATITVYPPPGRGGGIPAVLHLPLTFATVPDLNVIGIRYSYYNVPAALTAQLSAVQPGLRVTSGWWQARQIPDWNPLRAMAENALPVAHLNINDTAPAGDDYSAWGTAWFDCKAVQDASGNWSCSGYADAKNWETTYVDHLCPSGGCTAMLLQPEIDIDGEDGTDWMSAAGNHINNMQGEGDPASQGDTLAHELGHALGLQHTWVDPSFPRSDGGLGPYIALRYSPVLATVPGRNAGGATTSYDLMSYSRPAWFSPYSYCKALATQSSHSVTCPDGLIG